MIGIEGVPSIKTLLQRIEVCEQVIVKQVEDADQRRREEQAQARIELRRYQARERAEARQRARHAAKDELRSIVKGWNEAFALEAFFTELSRRAATLAGDERADLEARIETARELMGGRMLSTGS